MKCPYVMKICSKCEEILHVSRYYKKKSCKYGVDGTCKECCKKKSNKYYEEHRDERLKYAKDYREEHKDDIKEYKNNNKEKFDEYNKEYQKKYREEHKEERKEYDKKYREEHKEERSEYFNKYYEEHKEELKEYNYKWRNDNPEKLFNNSSKRRFKENTQGDGISEEQWYEMMKFFNWTCAYSEEYIGGSNNKNIRSIDHIVPLDNGGEHEVWNCVPMLKSYNSQKRISNMLEWYLKQPFFSIERLTKIYEWRIYAYEKWGKEMI